MENSFDGEMIARGIALLFLLLLLILRVKAVSLLLMRCLNKKNEEKQKTRDEICSSAFVFIPDLFLNWHSKTILFSFGCCFRLII